MLTTPPHGGAASVARINRLIVQGGPGGWYAEPPGGVGGSVGGGLGGDGEMCGWVEGVIVGKAPN